MSGQPLLRARAGGALRRLGAVTSAYRATRLNNTPHRRVTHALAARTAGGVDLRLSYRTERFQQHRDHVTSVGLTCPASGSFPALGLRYALGSRGGSAYHFLAPAVSCRFGQKLTMSLSGQIIRHIKNNDLATVTLNYDLGDKRRLGMRLERRESDIRWFLAYHQNGYGSL